MEINELFGQEVLDVEAHNEIAFYIQKFQDFSGIQPVAVPPEFQGSLRDYQKQGLNWLNFLDEFNFGACLADDMGLGKTIQIIALILLQRQKKKAKHQPDCGSHFPPVQLASGSGQICAEHQNFHELWWQQTQGCQGNGSI